MNLKEMIRGAQLPITPRQERWLSENPNPQYSEGALAFAAKVLAQEVGGNRRRKSSYRSSGLGGCTRKQQFAALGYKGREDIDSTLANIFATGNFMHLKWQMSGLTEGWLAKAEVPYENEELDFGGTLDGVIWDGSLFEYKSINTRGFANVCEYGPKTGHIHQAHGYMFLADLPAVSFVYEDKGSGDWREFRVERNQDIEDQIIDMLKRLNEQKKERALPEPLRDCLDRTGYMYRHCPFRDICLETK